MKNYDRLILKISLNKNFQKCLSITPIIVYSNQKFISMK